MTFVCPFCQHSIQIQRTPEDCPKCHRPFDPGEWPEEAYSLKGMHPILKLSYGNGIVYEAKSYDFQIGRTPDGDGLTLDGTGVSRVHARVYSIDGAWYIEKKGSQDILVNGENIDKQELLSGFEIIIGSYILHVSISYEQNNPVNCPPGTLCSGNEIQLDKERIYIGSNDPPCGIVITNADPCHALIYKRSVDNSWYLVDCASKSGVKINGERIRNKALCPGDEITIAGVDFIFYGDKLVFGKKDATGLSLSFVNASAQVGKGAKDGMGKTILSNLCFNIAPGEFVGVLGPSGCGKSSLIQRIAGLANFSSGEWLINGTSYNTLPDAYLNAIAYQPQQNTLHDNLTLQEEFSSYCTLHALHGRSIKEDEVLAALRLVGLENKICELSSRLSGGQQRRAGIALALLRKPQMLILDEPTSGLDPATETEIMDYLRRISKQNKTVLCSTHIMGNLAKFDKVLVLSRGYMVFFGTPSELFEYFKISQPLELYRIFASGDDEHQERIAQKTSEEYYKSSLADKYTQRTELFDLPICEKPFFIKQVFGYWKRMLFETFSFLHKKTWWKSFWGSHICIQLIWQPFLVALFLKMSCAYKLLFNADQKEVLFFAAIASFWFGINNSVRELVKERVPWRCLERLERIPVGTYVLSKIMWLSFFCIVQTGIFSLFLFNNFVKFEVFNTATGDPITLTSSIFMVLSLVDITGAWIGLAISAAFKSENAAVSMLPIIIIPVLFFSQPIIRNDNFGTPLAQIFSTQDNTTSRFGRLIRYLHPTKKAKETERQKQEKYTRYAYIIKKVNPCNAPEILMDKINRKHKPAESVTEKEIYDAWLETILILGLYMAISLTLTIKLQTTNEKDWQGR